MAAALNCVAELSGHTDRVWRARWSPSGHLIASCGGDHTVRLWGQDATGCWASRETLSGVHTRTVRSVAWSPDGSRLVSASFDGTVGIWDVSDLDAPECVATLEGHENEVKDVAWSASGRFLATCGRDKSVWVWEAVDDGDFECVAVLRDHTQDVKGVAWHPHIDVLASASYDDTVRLWAQDEDDGEWVGVDSLRGHTSTVWAAAFSADGSRLYTASDDLSVGVWAAADPKIGREEGNQQRGGIPRYTLRMRHQRAHARTIFCVACCTHTGRAASVGADNALRVYDTPEASDACSETLEVVAEREGAHAGDINSVAWNPMRPGVLCTAGDDRLVRIWECPCETHSMLCDT